MKTYKINTYQFEELTDKAKEKVIYWMSTTFEPLDYEKDDGTIGYEYWDNVDEEFIQETCEINEYIFTKYGDPIHHIINK